MVIFPADWFDFSSCHFSPIIWFDFSSCHFSPIIVYDLAMFFMIHRPMHRTDLFIVSGADLEYTKNKHF